MKINAILDIISSKADRAGNRYFAFRYTRCKDGKQVHGRACGGDSNIRGILFYLNGGSWEPHDVYTTCHEFGYREFKDLTASWTYAGSQPEELATWVKKELKKKQE